LVGPSLPRHVQAQIVDVVGLSGLRRRGLEREFDIAFSLFLIILWNIFENLGSLQGFNERKSGIAERRLCDEAGTHLPHTHILAHAEMNLHLSNHIRCVLLPNDLSIDIKVKLEHECAAAGSFLLGKLDGVHVDIRDVLKAIQRFLLLLFFLKEGLTCLRIRLPTEADYGLLLVVALMNIDIGIG